MSYLACAMIRKIGVPCEKVKGKFIGSDGGHAFIEVYFPDAGWVFYDLSNRERGFKDLDCLITSGWAYWKICDGKFQWIDGFFCDEEDIKIYKRIKYGKSIRKGPLEKKIHGVMVYQRDVPETIKVRHRPIRELIMDISVEPGVREYSSNEKR